MRRSLLIAAGIAALLVLAGCSAQSASTSPPPVSSEINVVGTAGNSASASVPATLTSKPATSDPAAEEGIPVTLDVQMSAALGTTPISEARALQIAEKLKPAKSTSVSARHVMFARTGAHRPTDAWMVTFHDAELPGAGGTPAASAQTGSVALLIDSSTGAIVDRLAYQPIAR